MKLRDYANKIIYRCSLLCLLCTQCVPVQDPPPPPPLKINFNKAGIHDLWQAVDQRDRSRLNTMLQSKDPKEKLVALRAYYTIKDSTVLDTIAHLLTDTEPLIRQAAAFALGQSGFPKAAVLLTQAFQALDSASYHSGIATNILEAIGKTGDKKLEHYMATVKSYSPQDTHLLWGQILALYRLTSRGLSSKAATAHAVQLLKDTLGISKVRLMAAHYLARSKKLNILPYEEDLRRIGLSDPDPNIRMALALAFKHSHTNFSYLTLLDWYKSEGDYRVKINIIHALATNKNKDLGPFLLEAIADTNEHVALVAAQKLNAVLKRQDAKKVRNMARSTSKKPWQVRASLYRTANEKMSNQFRIAKTNMNQEIFKRYRSNNDPYIKSHYLKAWASYGANLDALIQMYANVDNVIIKTTILESLINNAAENRVRKIFWGYEDRAKRKVSKLMKEAVLTGDATAIALVCDAIHSNLAYWTPYFKSFDFVKKGADQLKLPKEFEAHMAAKKLMYAIEKKPLNDPDLVPKYNHPVDWTLVAEIPDTTPISIETSKGIIYAELYRNTAPGGVANFIQLAEADFFDMKAFHRVVPNFVIQSGCPLGNGFGSLDYSIRSDFSTLNYDQGGWIGMASIGPDTEGTQWFITHSPTPHLDGRYTILGRVTNGMAVVHKIEQGDRVKNIKVKR